MAKKKVNIDFTDPDIIDVPDSKALGDIAKIAWKLNMAKGRVERCAAELAEAQREHDELEQKTLPDLMLELGMKDFTLTDGTKILVKTEYHPSIAKTRQEEAFAWLRETGNDSIIKRSVGVQFGKGQDEAAEALLAELETMELEGVFDNATVHAGTLKAFVKETIEKENEPGVKVEKPLPRDLFGVHVIQRATIKKPKQE